MKNLKKLVAVLLVCAIMLSVFSGCSGNENSGLEKVRLVLDWVPNTNHTGIYVAKDLGYYEEFGIDLEILQTPDSGALPLVAAGNSEFGISYQEELGFALALDTPFPVTTVATLLSHNTSGFLSVKDKDITSPKDFEGKKILVWESPIAEGIVRDMVEGDGGDFSKVEMIYDSVSDIVTALQISADASWTYYTTDGINAEIQGIETNYFPISDYGDYLDYYTPILVGNNDYINANDKTTSDFLEATEKGYRYAAENPDSAAEILTKMVPEMDYDYTAASIRYLSKYYLDEQGRWGTIDADRWNSFYSWLYTEGLVEKDIADKGFTMEYLQGGEKS